MNHLDIAKLLWKRALKPGMKAVDATLGNGHDALYLAQLLLTDQKSHLYGYDIQKSAVNASHTLLAKHNISLDQITLIEGSHETFQEITSSVDLIIYNLGYLPGGNKSITTKSKSTIKSIRRALEISSYISITCYPGHPEGEKETNEVIKIVQTIDPAKWSLYEYKSLLNPKAPRLLWLFPARGTYPPAP